MLFLNRQGLGYYTEIIVVSLIAVVVVGAIIGGLVYVFKTVPMDSLLSILPHTETRAQQSTVASPAHLEEPTPQPPKYTLVETPPPPYRNQNLNHKIHHQL